MEHVIYLIISDIFENITDTTMIKIMIPLTSAMCAYGKTLIKYRYVCVLSFFAALFYTFYIYYYLSVPPESRTFIVCTCVFIIRFIAAIVLGSATWLLHRDFRMRKSKAQPIDPVSLS